LKKNGTPASAHWSRISRTQPASIARAFGPDSPPTITQSIPRKSRSGNGPSSGSSDRNFTCAPVSRKSSIRRAYAPFSTLTPIQMCPAHGNSPLNARSRADRFVNTWYRCQCARFITSNTRSTNDAGTSWWNKSLIEFTNIVCGFRHDNGNASACSCSVNRNPFA